MYGITIVYEYSGDEAAWKKATSDFIAAIDSDKEIAGRLHYRVNKARDGNRRVHWGWWDSPETVAKMQSRDYFKTFSAKVREMAGGTLSSTQIVRHDQTAA
jgi:hypothetical protein